MIAPVAVSRSTAPPPFLALVAHPVRWRLLRELAFGDHQVGELTRSVGQRQSLVSYHLGRLRAGGLVSSRRSSADGRDAYYRANLVGCGASLTRVAAALHPGLQLVPTASGGVPSATTTARSRVLFLCTGNSARSQMAEALLRHLSDGRVEAASAGSHPKPLHPNAVRVMGERGIDISGARTKHLRRFARRRFDYVVSLCDRVREVCPEFPGQPAALHWSMPDPAAGGTSDEETYPAFEHAAEELETRIRFLLHHLFPSPVPTTWGGSEMTEEMVNVRYMVDDVDAAVAFYTTHLGFEVLSNAGPAFADVSRGQLRLLLSGPTSSAGRPMPDGRQPGPGGWNRIHLIVDDIAAETERLRASGLSFRNDIVTGPGGSQILLEDPSGNPIELFQPASR